MVEPRAAVWAAFRNHYPGCADCSREVARFATLTTALAREGAGSSAHPSEEQILALATDAGEIAHDERVRLEAHLSGCAPCRTELAVVRGFEFAAVTIPPRRRLRFGPRPALAAAAVLLLAIPAAVLLWRRAPETSAIPGAPTAVLERSAPIAPVTQAPPNPEPEPPSTLAAREETPATQAPETRPKSTPSVKPPPVAVPPSERAVVEASPPESPRPIEMAALVPREPPLYAPGALANGPSVRIEGAPRSLGAGAPTPVALGPAHIGVSAHESPSLYFFLPEGTASPIEVTVVNSDAVTPLLETTLPGPLEAGVHRVSLAEHGARLQPGMDYRWFVALVTDPERRSQDAVSVAGIRYTPSGPELGGVLSAEPARAAHLYAGSGLWYDAFDQLSSWLTAEPGATLLRSQRAALLEQVGLDDPAAFERGSAPSD